MGVCDTFQNGCVTFSPPFDMPRVNNSYLNRVQQSNANDNDDDDE